MGKVEPGAPAGPCPICGEPRVQVGWGTGTVAVYCEPCDLLEALHSDIWVAVTPTGYVARIGASFAYGPSDERPKRPRSSYGSTSRLNRTRTST